MIISIFGLQVPKSGDQPVNSLGYHILLKGFPPAKLPRIKNNAVWIANAIPFERRTMLLTERTLKLVCKSLHSRALGAHS